MVSFRQLISYADSYDNLLMIVGTLGALGCGCAQPLLILFVGELINIVDPRRLLSEEKLLSEVSEISLHVLYAALGAAAASLLEVAAWMITAERQSSRIRVLYLKALLRQDVAYFDLEFSAGESMSKICGDAILIQDALGDKVGNVVESWAKFVAGWTVGFLKIWKLAVVTVSVIPAVAVVGGLIGLGLVRATGQAQEANTEAGKVADQVLGSIRTVASNTGESRAVKTYDAALAEAERAGVKLGYVNGFGVGLTLFLMFSSYGLAMWFGSRIVARREATGGDVIIVIFSIIMGGVALGQIFPHVSAIATGLRAGDGIFKVIERKPAIDSNDSSGRILPTVRGEIHLKSVHFAYPSRPDHAIFSNFKLLIAAGSTAALVGESGSGKSTVIQLIERFYDPDRGQVLLDGVDIKDLQLKWLRSQIALVSQEPVLFAASIRENIIYGKDGATEEEVVAACDLANAALFINHLPQGFDTQVGERGIQLSGGQKQRMAIARAILKNPRILLLDEATSALDAESESAVIEALDRVMVNRTSLVVAHRLSTIKKADLIAVVQKGAVVETGSHEELILNRDSAYNQLIHLQSSHLEETAALEDELAHVVDHLSVESERYALPDEFHKSASLRTSSGYLTEGGGLISRTLSLIESLSSFRSSGRHLDIDPEPVRSLLHDRFDLEKSGAEEQRVPLSRLVEMNRPELPFFLVGILGSIGHGALLPLIAILLTKTIVEMYQPSAHEVRAKGSEYALLFVALGGLILVSEPIEKICFCYVGNRLVRRLRLRSFQNILRQEIGWFDDERNSSARLGARLVSDAAAVRNVVGDTLTVVVQVSTTVVLSLAIALSASWELTLIVLGVAPFLALHGLLNVRSEHGLAMNGRQHLDSATQIAGDAVANIRTVASFCAEEKIVDLYRQKTRGAHRVGVKQGLSGGVALGFANFSFFAGYSACFYAGAQLVFLKRLTFLDVFQVFWTIALSSMGVAMALRLGPDVGKARPAVRSIFGLLDRISNISSAFDKETPPPQIVMEGRIEFHKVSFRYPTRPTVQIFRKLSFTVSAGKALALVGGSGSGKSTVISLIERFYDVEAGAILIDGLDIRLHDLKFLRQNTGLVSQEPVLFDDTIRENIVYGKESNVNEEEVHEAAKVANAHAFICSLPDGYNTRVGERGIQLSGGQKQRVAIARAVIKSPKILLLDEATSALDSESEQIVQKALDQIMIGRTTVVVAHRLSTVRNCDEILVLKNGSIVENGTYDDLIKAGGAFASLARQYFNTG